MKKTNSEEAPSLDIHQAARKLNISPKTTRRHARNKVIPAVKVGGVWRFQRTVIDSLLRGETTLAK